MTITEITHDDKPEKIAENLKKVQRIDYQDGATALTFQREGARAVELLIEHFQRDKSLFNIPLIAHVLVRLQDLQVRDYAMGLVDAQVIDSLWRMWRDVAEIAPHGYKAPPLTIFAAICYELEDATSAADALTEALFDDPDYPLAKLLRRVFAAGWPPESLAIMRAELHPKITAALFDNADLNQD